MLVLGDSVAFSCGMGRSKASASGSPVAAAPACSKVACAGVTVMVMVICCIVKKAFKMCAKSKIGALCTLVNQKVCILCAIFSLLAHFLG